MASPTNTIRMLDSANPIRIEYVVDACVVNRRAPGTRPLSLIHISEPTRLGMISYAVFCFKKKKKKNDILDLTCKQ